MKTITIANQKGGVAKTSTAHALGVGLSKKGYKVLAIDMDAQCDFSDYCGIDTEKLETTLYTVFKGRATAKDAILNIAENLDLLPGDLELAAADSEFIATGREYILKEILEPITNDYDYCIIDTEPHLGILLTNALTATNSVIVPVTASRFSIKGLRQLNRFVSRTSKYTNPDLKIEGVLLTRYSSRIVLNRLLLDSIKNIAETLNTKLFNTTIRASVSMDESQMAHEDIFAQNSAIANDYDNFITELLKES